MAKPNKPSSSSSSSDSEDDSQFRAAAISVSTLRKPLSAEVKRPADKPPQQKRPANSKSDDFQAAIAKKFHELMDAVVVLEETAAPPVPAEPAPIPLFSPALLCQIEARLERAKAKKEKEKTPRKKESGSVEATGVCVSGFELLAKSHIAAHRASIFKETKGVGSEEDQRKKKKRKKEEGEEEGDEEDIEIVEKRKKKKKKKEREEREEEEEEEVKKEEKKKKKEKEREEREEKEEEEVEKEEKKKKKKKRWREETQMCSTVSETS